MPACGPSWAATRSGILRCAAPTRVRWSAARAGSSSRSPAAETPPPMTTTSGSRAATRLAAPTPSQSPTEAKARRATRSPSSAAVVTIGPVTRSGWPSHISASTDGCSTIIVRALRTRALPEEYCSQQPRRPHSQAWPSGTTCMWPNSPAMPLAPRRTRPSRSTAPPMPVPIVIISAELAPRAAPWCASARAAQLASLSSTTGQPRRSSSRSRSGSPCHGRCGANITRSPAESTKPAAATPAPANGWPAADSRIASTRASSTWLVCTRRPGVVRRAVPVTRPWSSTTPASTLVPPMSTPTTAPVLIRPRASCRRGRCARHPCGPRCPTRGRASP